MKKGRRRLADGLIGLSSLAVVSAYAVGYINTDSKAQLATISAPAVATEASQIQGPSLPQQPSSRQQLAPTATPRPSAGSAGVQAASYKDGTFTGIGTSRHGDIEATIVVQGGRIVSAEVSRCLTRYPCSYVGPLVQEVLSRQAVPVHRVSGATDSSRAYTQAVANALAKAAQV